MAKVKVGVIGHSGYSGAEVVKILRRHPHAEPVLFDHRADGGGGVPYDPEALRREGVEALFLATPAEVSLELAPGALDHGVKVIDLSGAFRLRTADRYRRWYGAEHARPDLLAEAAYGLPELCRDPIRRARLIANPGCYPTAASLALQPLVEADVIDRAAGVVCDAKSGVTGAGKKPSARTHFCEVSENFSAYAVLDHRHVPEVLMNCGLQESDLSFTAQLLPVRRGILETIYFRPRRPLDGGELLEIYRRRYGREPFIRIYGDGKLPDLHAVAHTNFCDIGVKSDPGTRRVVVVAAIDNLGKGAAGQAVQNLNLALGVGETEGLL